MEKVGLVGEVVEMLVVVEDSMIAVVVVVVMMVGVGAMVGFNSCGHSWVDSGGGCGCSDS